MFLRKIMQFMSDFAQLQFKVAEFLLVLLHLSSQFALNFCGCACLFVCLLFDVLSYAICIVCSIFAEIPREIDPEVFFSVFFFLFISFNVFQIKLYRLT